MGKGDNLLASVLALQAHCALKHQGGLPSDKYSVALSCVSFLLKKAAAAASELHRLRRKPAQWASRPPGPGSGTLHVRRADSEEVLVQHGETGCLLPAASGRGGTFGGPDTP